MSQNLEVRTNKFSGRSYYSTCALSANEVLLDIDTPYSDTIYKQFRTEVCAECFDYQSGRRAFLTCREYSEDAGLSFCNTGCRDSWIRREGVELVDLLTKLETRRVKKKGKEVETEGLRDVVTEVEIEEAWGNVEEEEQVPKQVRKWGQLLLDEFEADLARYVLTALYHQAMEARSSEGPYSNGNGDSSSTPTPTKKTLEFGYANWNDFAALQANETTQVKLFPELLDNHLRIYQVLKALFGQTGRQLPMPGKPNGLSNDTQSEVLQQLGHAITTKNVRRILGVDPGNSFGIWETPLTEESECLGFAVYPIPSFFNHRRFFHIYHDRLEQLYFSRLL